MDTAAVRTTPGTVEEFVKFAHEAVEAWRERAVELEDDIARLVDDTRAVGMRFGEAAKFGNEVENKASKAAVYSFMAGLLATHLMKSRGISHAFDVPGVTAKRKTSKPSRFVSRGVVYEL